MNKDKPLSKIPVPLDPGEVIALYRDRLLKVGREVETVVKELRQEEILKDIYNDHSGHDLKWCRSKLDSLIDNAKLFRVEFESFNDFISVFNKAEGRSRPRKKSSKVAAIEMDPKKIPPGDQPI